MKNKKLTRQIMGAALAVIMTAGLGTAALASSEPSGEPPQAPVGQVQQAPEFSAPTASQEPAAPAQQNAVDRGAPPDAQEAPNGEPGASDEMSAPSQEPGASAEMGQPSGEPDAPQPQEQNGPASGEPGMDAQGPQNTAPGGNDRDVMSAIRQFFDQIIGRLRVLLGMGEPAQQAQNAPQQGQKQPGGEMGNASKEPTAQQEQAAPSGEMSDASQEPGASGEMGQSSGEPAAYAAANTVRADADGLAYASVNGGENAVLVSGDDVTLTNVTVSKTGDTTGENADFYGVNAGILASSGAKLTIENADITTDGAHANGVFSYGAGTVVNISDSTITTSANNSGGIMTTGGATLNASNLTVSTSGNSSAAIRSDRGGGTVTVSEGSYATSGVGSPAIYSTADISVSDAALTSTTSEAVVIEGGNSVTLINDTVSGNNGKLNGQSTQRTNVLIYQSMSGDAAGGSSAFTMAGGSMTAGTGSMFHVTNVTTTINLSGVDFTYAADSDVFLDASADSWGTVGRNGGSVTLNLDGQDIVGIITQDSVSSVAVSMTNGSTWTLTGDSYIASLDGDTSGIDLNGHTLYVNGVAWRG